MHIISYTQLSDEKKILSLSSYTHADLKCGITFIVVRYLILLAIYPKTCCCKAIVTNHEYLNWQWEDKTGTIKKDNSVTIDENDIPYTLSAVAKQTQENTEMRNVVHTHIYRINLPLSFSCLEL